MPAGLITAGLMLMFFGGIAATNISQTGPWPSIIIAGAGLLSFLAGFVLYIIERR